jgi:hypothetical protein
MKNWQKLASDLAKQLGASNKELEGYRRADADMIRSTLRGYGPHSSKQKSEAGARAVYNLSAAHVPAIVAAGATTASNRPFKNRYDLRAMLGQATPSPRPLRERVDDAIGQLIKQTDGRDLYYGAAEVNGAGIRYYGDICLVLKPSTVAADTLVLDRNSFDLGCEPIRSRITMAGTAPRPQADWPAETAKQARELEGRWDKDLADMAIYKILDGSKNVQRRLTTAPISDGVLSDEDYLEVVRLGSFGADELEEARISAADAGADGRIADRLMRGPSPSLAELQWRHRRRLADQALATKRVRTRIVATNGRARS